MSKKLTSQEIFDVFPKKEKGKLNIYFHISENSGVGYYRQYLPAVKIREHGLANIMISDFRWGDGDHVEPDTKMLFQIARWADVIVVGRRDQAQFYAQWGGVREFFNVPVIIDTDYDIRHVRPFNPGYQGYQPGSEAITWNKYGTAKIFDAVTVTTEDLKDIYKKKNPRTYILPNSIDMKEWDSHPRKEWNDGKIRIGFLASAAHTEGVFILKKPIKRILEKYPQTLFYINDMYLGNFQDFPDELKTRISGIPWIKLQEWPKGIKALGLDIGCAPLADNHFNRSKSNLRYLEYSASGMPSVISPVKPYLCVKNGETGFLAKEGDEWYAYLEKLILDETLRVQIAKNAYEFVSKNFDIDKNVDEWVRIYADVHNKFHEFYGKKKEFIDVGKGKYKKIL